MLIYADVEIKPGNTSKYPKTCRREISTWRLISMIFDNWNNSILRTFGSNKLCYACYVARPEAECLGYCPLRSWLLDVTALHRFYAANYVTYYFLRREAT